MLVVERRGLALPAAEMNVEPMPTTTTGIGEEHEAPITTARPHRPTLGQVLRLEAPALAAVPRLALPDRHGRLEGVDAEARRLERLAPVRR